MKKVLSLLIALFCVSSGYAQWSITPEVGMTAVNRVDYDEWKSNIKLGAAVQYEFNSLFSLKSGLYYTSRSNHFTSAFSIAQQEGSSEGPTSMMMGWERSRGYLQIPIMANFGWSIGNDTRLNFAFGPYVGYRVRTAGSIQSSYYYNYGYPGYGSYEFGYGYGGYGGYGGFALDWPFSFSEYADYVIDGGHRFDWGTSATVGVEVKNWVMNLGYDMSWAKESKYDSVGLNFHTLSLSLGYKFNL